MPEPDSELYLILHKVRGEPTPSIASKIEVNGETMWVTEYGHRAYPVYQTELLPLLEAGACTIMLQMLEDQSWLETAEEHFKVEPSKAKVGGRGKELIAKLGISVTPFPMETERRA